MNSLAETGQPPVEENPLAKQEDNIAQLTEILRNSRTTFFAMILASVYSFLAIATTTDAALLSNSSATPLPIIQVNVPIVWFYYVAPIILAVLFVYFHLYLERFWRCVMRLPLRHPDGRGLDDYVYPWLISSAFIRGEIRQLSTHHFSARLEAWLSLLLGWWLFPIVLLFYWARYLVAHDWMGTFVHIALIVLTAGVAVRFFFMAKNALQAMDRLTDREAANEATAPESELDLTALQVVSTTAGMVLLGAALVYLSASAIRGLPEEVCLSRGPEAGCGPYRLGRHVWEMLDVQPYLEVKEERFVTKPKEWQELLADSNTLRSYLEMQRGLLLVERDLRGMSASEAFLPGSRIQGGILDYADLRHAILTGSRLVDVSLTGADLTDADLQYVKIVNAHFEDVFALAARFDHASFTGATSEARTKLNGDFSGASFNEASGDKLLFHAAEGGEGSETSLRETSLRGTSFTWSDFRRVDLSGARIEEATLTHNEFSETDFSRATIRGAFMNLSTFTNCRFISTEIEDSFFEDAKFIGSELGYSPPQAAFSGDAENMSVPAVPRKLIVGFHGFGVKFEGDTQIRNLEFVEADLRFARFENVQFENVLFTKSDLSGSTFKDVDLSAVEFDGVDLSSAKLEEAGFIPPRLLDGACGNADTGLPEGVKISPCRDVSS